MGEAKRQVRIARWLLVLGTAALVAYGLLTAVGLPLAGMVGGLGWILWLESRARYGWADGYCDALKHRAERERQ